MCFAALALLTPCLPAVAGGAISTVGCTSIAIPFAAALSQGQLVGSAALAVGIANTPFRTFIMDTGSAGMVVTPDIHEPPAGTPPLYSNVVQAYTSNGVV